MRSYGCMLTILFSSSFASAARSLSLLSTTKISPWGKRGGCPWLTLGKWVASLGVYKCLCVRTCLHVGLGVGAYACAVGP